MLTIQRLLIFTGLLIAFIPLQGEEATSKRTPITRENAAQIQQLEMLGRGGIYDLVWSPDGTKLAIIGPVGVWVYDTSALDAPPQHLGMYYGWIAAFSPNSSLLATSDRNGWRLWDVTTGRLMRTVLNTRIGINSIAFSPNGQLLVTGGYYPGRNAMIQLWDVNNGRELAYLDVREAYQEIDDLAFSPDGDRLLVGATGTTGYLYDVNLILEKRGSEAYLAGEAIKDRYVDHRKVIYMEDQQYILESIHDSKGQHVFQVRTFPQNHILTSVTTGTLESGDFYQVTTIDFNPATAMLAVSGQMGKIQLIDSRTNTVAMTLSGHQETTLLAFDPTGKRVASYGDGKILKIWDLDTGSEHVITDLHTMFGYVVSFHPNSDFLAFGTQIRGDLIQIWDVPKNVVVGRFSGYGNWTSDLDFSPDGKLLAISSGDECCPHILDLKTGEEKVVFAGHEGEYPQNGIKDVFFADDSLLISSGDDGTTRFWDVLTGEQIDVFDEVNGNDALAAVIDQTGTYVAIDKEFGESSIWKIDSHEIIASLPPGYSEGNLVNSPDGRFFATSDWLGSIHIWKWDNLEEIYNIETKTRSISDVVFSPDGQLLAVITTRGDLFIFDIISGKQLTQFKVVDWQVYSVDWSQDGALIALTGREGTVHILGVP